jgi:hypothetical protein
VLKKEANQDRWVLQIMDDKETIKVVSPNIKSVKSTVLDNTWGRTGRNKQAYSSPPNKLNK